MYRGRSESSCSASRSSLTRWVTVSGLVARPAPDTLDELIVGQHVWRRLHERNEQQVGEFSQLDRLPGAFESASPDIELQVCESIGERRRHRRTSSTDASSLAFFGLVLARSSHYRFSGG